MGIMDELGQTGEDRIEDLNSEIANLQRTNEAQRAEIKEAKDQNDKDREAIDGLRETQEVEKQRYKTDNETLVARVTDLQRQLSEAKSDAAPTAENKDGGPGLFEALNMCNAETIRLAGDNVRLAEKVEAFGEVLEARDSTISQLSEDKIYLENAIEGLKQNQPEGMVLDVDAARTEFSRMREQLVEAKAEVSRLTKEKVELENNVQVLGKCVDDAYNTDVVGQANKIIAAEEDRKAAARALIEDKDRQIEEMDNQNQALNASLDALKAHVETMKLQTAMHTGMCSAFKTAIEVLASPKVTQETGVQEGKGQSLADIFTQLGAAAQKETIRHDGS